MITLSPLEAALILVDVVLLVWLGWLQLQNKALHRMLYAVSKREPVDPTKDLIRTWIHQAKHFGPDTPKGQAYRNRLREVGVDLEKVGVEP